MQYVIPLAASWAERGCCRLFSFVFFCIHLLIFILDRPHSPSPLTFFFCSPSVSSPCQPSFLLVHILFTSSFSSFSYFLYFLLLPTFTLSCPRLPSSPTSSFSPSSSYSFSISSIAVTAPLKPGFLFPVASKSCFVGKIGRF